MPCHVQPGGVRRLDEREVRFGREPTVRLDEVDPVLRQTGHERPRLGGRRDGV